MATIVTTNGIPLTYNDEWDTTHRPIQPKHLDTLDKVAYIMNTRDGHWYYSTTIYGAVLQFIGTADSKLAAYYPRLSAHTMNTLLSIPGFRWIECGENAFDVGLEH